MANFLEPLQLQVFFMNIFAGNPDYFIAISLITISAMAGFFRMTTLTLFFMLGIFLFAFKDYLLGSPILLLFSIITGLSIGFTLSKLWTQR